MEPENHLFEKEHHFPTSTFGFHVSFQGSTSGWTNKNHSPTWILLRLSTVRLVGAERFLEYFAKIIVGGFSKDNMPSGYQHLGGPLTWIIEEPARLEKKQHIWQYPPEVQHRAWSYLANRKIVFQPPFFRVYVKLRGCSHFLLSPHRTTIHDPHVIL